MKVNVKELNLNNYDEINKKIGKLTNNEIIQLLKDIESNIINKKYVDENIFFKLSETIENRLEYAQTFCEYRKLIICIEKLLWLIKKNIDCEYNQKEEEQYNNIIKINPNVKNSLIKFLDLENEREERIISLFKMRNFYKNR